MANEKCYFCDNDNKSLLEKHHIIPKRFNGSDKNQNLVTLCSNCHNKIEDLYDNRFFYQVFELIEEKIEDDRFEEECEYCGKKFLSETDPFWVIKNVSVYEKSCRHRFQVSLE